MLAEYADGEPERGGGFTGKASPPAQVGTHTSKPVEIAPGAFAPLTDQELAERGLS